MLKISKYIKEKDRFEGEPASYFPTLGVLWEISFVKAFRYAPHHREDRVFYRYSISREKEGAVLLAEYNGGAEWCIVGFIEGEDRLAPLDLPEPSYVKELKS